MHPERRADHPSTVNIDGDFDHELEKMAIRRRDVNRKRATWIACTWRTSSRLSWDGWEEGTGYIHVLNAADPARKMPNFQPRTPESYIAAARATAIDETLLREFYHPPLGANVLPASDGQRVRELVLAKPIRYQAPARYVKKNDPRWTVRSPRIWTTSATGSPAMNEAASTHRGQMYAGVDIGREGDKTSIWIKQRDGILRRRAGHASGLRVRGATGPHPRARLPGERRLDRQVDRRREPLGMMPMEIGARYKSRVDGRKWTNQSKALMFTYAKSQVERSRMCRATRRRSVRSAPCGSPSARPATRYSTFSRTRTATATRRRRSSWCWLPPTRSRQRIAQSRSTEGAWR